jgi:glycine/D-amino acid oxidase-like deaminating enzyme
MPQHYRVIIIGCGAIGAIGAATTHRRGASPPSCHPIGRRDSAPLNRQR